MIHPSAVIHPGARVGAHSTIGPFCVVDDGVTIGESCEIGPHVYITGLTEIGANNKIHAGVVIGDWPQDLRFPGGKTGVVIGDNNVIREHVTVHRSNDPSSPTWIGSNNLLMVNSHVGHNARVGSHVIIANGALLGGHVTLEDRAFISGNCLVHQCVRVGMLALMQGGSAISKDLPPFTVARGDNRICGLNTVGLRRAGIAAAERLEIKRLYHLLFRGDRRLPDALQLARPEFTSPSSKILLDFLQSGTRGFCLDNRRATASAEDRD